MSIVIPCYNQAHYLGAAIESALAQTYPHVEVVVVDDGSIDNTATVARSYDAVCCIEQANVGLAGARNSGLARCRGRFIVFLDADDLLMPGAVAEGMAVMDAHLDCLAVAGHYERVGADGQRLEAIPFHGIAVARYEDLLGRNFIMMHGAVMYRRETFDRIGLFDTSLRACEDYDMYLRVAAADRICCHDRVVAQYRWHGNNMTADPVLMLSFALAVLDRQWPLVKDSPTRLTQYREGRRRWRQAYGRQVLRRVQFHIRERRWRRAAGSLAGLFRHDPSGCLALIAQAALLRQFKYIAPRGRSLAG